MAIYGNVVFVLGPLPPPLHGLSHATAAMAAAFETSGMVAHRLDTTPRYSGGRASKIVARLLSRPKALLRILCFLVANLSCRQRTALYMAVSGGDGKYGELLFVAVARLFGLPLLLHHHSFQYVSRQRLSAQMLFRLAGAKALHIALCEEMERALRMHYASVRSTAVMSNAALLDLPVGKASIGRPLQTIGFLSNIAAAKGIDQFIELIRMLRARGADVLGHVAGPFVEIEGQRLVEAAVACGTVRYLGPVYGQKKLAFFSEIDIFAFPSRYNNEVEPFVLLEALSSGIPIVASDRGCIPSLLGCDDLMLDPDGAELAPAVDWIMALIKNPNRLDTARSDAIRRSAELTQRSEKSLQRIIDIVRQEVSAE
jgi:glycosyltransferase involved in cell wall biosynthesis